MHVCIVCVSVSAQHFQPSFPLSLSLNADIFSVTFHGTPHSSGSLCAAQKRPDVVATERERGERQIEKDK